ncbi:AAA-domain-containing protein [Zopfia rhizophila CBS 207.26]|uniref:AAA-domain-containing protein n=1 Tax=Zopfia rhizophila CBS 207.26 TaxID=1314779 RepID=A0A6A6EJ93_9PEZI|nr:AAA-domain-containing protein [Zopfia rhizophila CBS 207.26]
MHAVVRPALRSASRSKSPARFIKGRRYPHSLPTRSFHSTPHTARSSTPPSNPDTTPNDENESHKNTRETAASAEQPDAAAATEDPDVLAQKLQRSKEMVRRYGSALKRSQRRNRGQDLPPVHIPTWFLERRVMLRENIEKNVTAHKSCTLTIRDKISDVHGACTLSFGNYSRGVATVVDLAQTMCKKFPSKEDYDKLVEGMARESSGEDAQAPAKAVEPIREADLDTLQKKLESEPEQSSKDGSISSANDTKARSSKRTSPLLLAEIQATIAASLSAIRPDISNSFPSAKTNLILHAPSNEVDTQLKRIVLDMRTEMGADIIELEAIDLAQLAGDYIGEGPDPSPYSIRSLSYETHKYGSEFANYVEDLEREDANEDEQDPATSEPPQVERSYVPGPRVAHMGIILDLKAQSPVLKALGLSSGNGQGEINNGFSPGQQHRTLSQSEAQLEDLKLSTLLEALIDSNEIKRAHIPSKAVSNTQQSVPPPAVPFGTAAETPNFFDYSLPTESVELDFSSILPDKAKPWSAFTINIGPPSIPPRLPHKPKIIYVRDIKQLNATRYGSRMLQKLEDIVRSRRSSGESIMIIGSTCSADLVPELSASGIQTLQSEGDASFSRTIVVPFAMNEAFPVLEELFDVTAAAKEKVMEMSSSGDEKRKFRMINLRHIADMLRSLDPVASASLVNRERSAEQDRAFGFVYPPESLWWRVLTYDEVHRIALTALGLHLVHPSNSQLSWAHVYLAMCLLKVSDRTKFAWARRRAKSNSKQQKKFLDSKEKWTKTPTKESASKPDQAQLDLDRIASNATKHERRLLRGVVNPERIKTTFSHVQVPKDTIEAVRTLTSLSLLRPEAFNYGVLATDKISGVLLYGPPGTGKTLLAKAVAKESGATVLEVSGSEINDKYVGEGEKNVTAIFSLARKLSPCIVFLDEADAIFGSRDGSRSRVSHRDILNQFLKEWDGLNDLSVFIMVATNRPFDLDDAVIRRLPRRLLVDLPTQEDRKKVLQIHLRDEQLDTSVDIDELAKRTPLYSGSDLKNVAVAAALACVGEENEQAAIAAAKTAAEEAQSEPEASAIESSDNAAGSPESTSPSPSSSNPKAQPQTRNPPILLPGRKYNFPEKRTLHWRHFEKAMQEISASISEDMSSLNAIKKFDEQYGDRKGRRKKNAYGFGIRTEKNESAARVRK